MTAPESEVFPAGDRYHERKIKTEDSIQKVHLQLAGLNLALGTLPMDIQLPGL